MWRHRDDRGREWDVTVGRESWGALYAIFMERGRRGAVRQTALDASSHAEATAQLDGLDDEGWSELFGAALPKTLG